MSSNNNDLLLREGHFIYRIAFAVSLLHFSKFEASLLHFCLELTCFQQINVRDDMLKEIVNYHSLK